MATRHLPSSLLRAVASAQHGILIAHSAAATPTRRCATLNIGASQQPPTCLAYGERTLVTNR